MTSRASSLPVRRWTVEEFDRIAEALPAGETERLELLDGVIYEMTPINPPHAGAVRALNRLFSVLAGQAIVDVQNPLVLGPMSKPQPDLMLLRPRPDDYRSAHPSAEDVLLVVEIADSSAEIDRRLKLPLYATAGVAEVWLTELQREIVTRYRDPVNGKYTNFRVFRRGQQISPAAFPDLILQLDDILGPTR
ncbi:MAG: hypothetical protein KatS3mg060_1784 [Dehalococcoidia bacterium]|jgi:Uma2 family endonuclease|nr:MAG: hypothetical protein KatS3mg060_1784 [Dehalococcoidia bacterium]